MKLENKVVAITGAGGIICSAFAKDLAAQGAKVAVLDLREEAAQVVVDEIKAAGGTAVAVGCNVLEAESLEAAKAKDKTANIFTSVEIPADWDNAQMATFNDMGVKVTAYATQTVGFNNATQALITAFPAENAWGSYPTTTTPVTPEA